MRAQKPHLRSTCVVLLVGAGTVLTSQLLGGAGNDIPCAQNNVSSPTQGDLKDVVLRRLCRRIPFLYGFEAPESSDSVTAWINAALKPPTFQSISLKESVALKFTVGKGNLLPFTELRSGGSETGRNTECDHMVHGPVFVHREWWMNARSHFIYDHFPVIAWLRAIMQSSFPKEVFQLDGSAQKLLLLDDVKSNREFMHFFDKAFEERILWVTRDSTVCVHGKVYYPTYSTSSDVLDPVKSSSIENTASWHIRFLDGVDTYTPDGRPPGVISFGSADFVELARLWIAERSEHIVERPVKPIVLFYVRHEGLGGRVMDAQNDAFLLQGLRDKLVECKREEQIVLFNGLDSQGQELSQKEQFLLFHSASLVVGPHGGATASILFMSGGSTGIDKCQNRPQIIEYIAGPRSSEVHYEFASYWSLYFSADWAEYHIIQFAQNSTREVTYVNAKEWNLAMHLLFSPERCAPRMSWADVLGQSASST